MKNFYFNDNEILILEILFYVDNPDLDIVIIDVKKEYKKKQAINLSIKINKIEHYMTYVFLVLLCTDNLEYFIKKTYKHQFRYGHFNKKHYIELIKSNYSKMNIPIKITEETLSNKIGQNESLINMTIAKQSIFSFAWPEHIKKIMNTTLKDFINHFKDCIQQ